MFDELRRNFNRSKFEAQRALDAIGMIEATSEAVEKLGCRVRLSVDGSRISLAVWLPEDDNLELSSVAGQEGLGI